MAMIRLSFIDGVSELYPLAECVKYFGLIANVMADFPSERIELATTSAEFARLFAQCGYCDGPINSECAGYMLCVFPTEGDIIEYFAATGNAAILRDAIRSQNTDTYSFEFPCHTAIVCGNYDCFTLLLDAYMLFSLEYSGLGRQARSELASAAAKQGPEFVKYLYASGIRVDSRLRIAVSAKQYETLKFLLTIDKTPRERAYIEALEHDDDIAAKMLIGDVSQPESHNYFRCDSVKCMRLVYGRIPMVEKICIEAAEWRAIKCLRDLHEHGYEIARDTVLHAASGMECMVYAWDVCHDMHPDTCERAAMFGQFDVLVFAHERGAILTSGIYWSAVKNGGLKTIEYAFAHGCQIERRDYAEIMRSADSPERRAICRYFGGEVTIETARGVKATLTYSNRVA